MADIPIVIAIDTDKQTVNAAYAQAITDLQAIQAATDPTNAQVVAAVKKLADIQEKLLEFLARQING
ncbi:MAG: hypothetical protein HY891_07765 [Deltaproteobacteria bacterium]|nr:hypothetical protein [Deltaproteobacteria bacterium]